MASENNEKIENLLNLALDATEREREKSIELHIGFDETDNVWEVVVKYGGTREALLEAFPMITVTSLSNGYAVLQIPQNLVETVAAFPSIEYMEKPKLLFAASDSCNRKCAADWDKPFDRKRCNRGLH